MKAICIIGLLALLTGLGSVDAQVTVAEPEFMNQYYVLTTDSTADLLPKETAVTSKEEKTKTGSVLGKLKKGAEITSKAGFIGGLFGLNGGNIDAARKAFDIAENGMAVEGIASAANELAGGGKAIFLTFKKKASSYRIAAGNTVRIVVRPEDNDHNPEDLYRIIKLEQEKKKRRYKWMDISYALIGTKDAADSGYVAFTAHKYGEQSHLLTIDAEQLQPGEYAIVFINPISATEIGAATFGVE